jgi:hypothetical protein
LIKLAELSDSDLEQSINRVPHPLVLAARTSSSPLRGAGYKRTSILIPATRFFAPEFLASHCTKALASKK